MSKRYSGIQFEKAILSILNKNKQREHEYHNPVLIVFNHSKKLGVLEGNICKKWFKLFYLLHLNFEYLFYYFDYFTTVSCIKDIERY